MVLADWNDLIVDDEVLNLLVSWYSTPEKMLAPLVRCASL